MTKGDLRKEWQPFLKSLSQKEQDFYKI